MSDTNNRNPQRAGLQSVRGDEGALPDRGTGIGFQSANVVSGIDDTLSLGKMSGAGSDAIGSSNDLPNKAVKFTGTTSGETSPNLPMGRMGGTGSDEAFDTTPGDESMAGDRD